MGLGMFSCMKVWIWGCLVVRRYGFVECLVVRRYVFGEVEGKLWCM